MTAALPSPTEPTDAATSSTLPEHSSRADADSSDVDPDSTLNVNTPQASGHPSESEPATHVSPLMPQVGEDRAGMSSSKDEEVSSIWPNDLPPSPPLTRPSTAHGEDTERDVAESNPLEDESEDNHFSETFVAGRGVDKEDIEEEEDEEEEKRRPRVNVVRKPSRIDPDAKMEPQPWDLVDPPQTNGDYYASLRQYNTLQSSRTRAPIPKSTYYFGPPPSDSAYGTQPMGQIGLHHPREILRVERDYSGGELIQFAPIYLLELEGRITPTQFLETINAFNEILISAHSMKHSFIDNALAVFTLQLSRLLFTSHYEKEMRRLQQLVDDLNAEVYNPVGLNILWPRKVAFLFVSAQFPSHGEC
ncbi:Golgin subfamily A member 7/ERF4 family-domain-containing protein [Roridomyces roridus]|uniref:Ras modification protein ERF4 n=1 Tax=Roridomyces roridus TaxID=1738132 RepID=A0AAD7BTE7_9AGAR|nr:Golgin subfamily A member 7/ERF4 family-domain-containing protein [Roridomyces roridus]